MLKNQSVNRSFKMAEQPDIKLSSLSNKEEGGKGIDSPLNIASL
jgi:hypothetical protein